MEARLKIATVASVGSIIIAAVALSLAPAGATSSFGWMPMNDDTFEATNKNISEVEEKNYIDVSQSANQTAYSGSVAIHHTDDIEGNLATGNAANAATSAVTVTAMNSASAPAVATPVMPVMDFDEFDDVTLSNVVKTEVESKNDVDVNNNVNQTAYSGSVSVDCVDDVSGVTTGSATNTATLSTTVTASN